jgi:hypothetical protein
VSLLSAPPLSCDTFIVSRFQLGWETNPLGARQKLYREALDAVPTQLDALKALERIHRNRSEWLDWT